MMKYAIELRAEKGCYKEQVGTAHQDIEIGIVESPACNWQFPGTHGDEVALNYKINV